MTSSRGFRDRLVAFHAVPVRPEFHAIQGLVDLFECSLLVLDQAQGKLLIVIVGAQIRHMQG